MEGWIIINKPVGASSAKIVSQIKKLLPKNTKVGHAGTLDPLASGVLPIAIGQATKLCAYMLDTDKKYEFEVTWGQQRTTDDAAGEVIQTSEINCSKEQILAALQNFKGEINQIPPQYSAIKVNGTRAYQNAYSGKTTKLQARKITIYDLQLISQNTNSAWFRLHCSKGTYVRSLARDLGQKLGCLGYVSALKRTAHGQFRLQDAIELDSFANLCNIGATAKAILPLAKVLDGIPVLLVSEDDAKRIRHGQIIDCDLEAKILAVKCNDKLVAMAASANGKLHLNRVFN